MKKLHFPEFNRLSLRSKLLFPVMGVTLLLLLLNLFMFLGTNHSIRNLDSVYESSIQINELAYRNRKVNAFDINAFDIIGIYLY